MTDNEELKIEDNVNYIFWILDYYENEFKEYISDNARDEMGKDFEECYEKLNEILDIIRG